MNAVQTVEDNLGTGENAVSGVEDVLTALQTGQVMTLVMTDDFDASGWADYTLPVFGTGKLPTTHPAGGETDSIVAVSLSNELVRLAVQFDAEIEIVHSTAPVDVADDGSIPQAGQDKPRAAAARALDDLGGVAAILRFPLAIDQTTAEM
jgi:peptide subunit release factor 1 (eRF1)